jgi:hypothetical protein
MESMTFKRYLRAFVLLSLSILIVFVLPIADPPLSVHAATSGRPMHVTMQTIPTSLGFATVLEGGTTNTDVDIIVLVVSNTDTVSHNLTIQDMQSPTPFALFSASPIAAKTTWVIPLNQTRFRNGMKWSVDASALVNGSMYGVH